MAANSKIEWTDATVNFWWGCTKVGPGCDHCYAETLSKRFGDDVWGPGKPRRKIKGANKLAFSLNRMYSNGFKVFTNSMSDFFDNEVPPEWRDEAFATIDNCPNLIWQIVTKRVSNVVKMLPRHWAETGWPKNVWLIVTVCNQDEMDRDGPRLKQLKDDLGIPVVGFSIEPLLGPIKSDWFGDWVIVGGESGPNARPMHPDWARSIRDQCEAAGTAFHFKQWGEWLPDRQSGDAHPYATARAGHRFDNGNFSSKVGKRNAGRMLDGVIHNQFPEVK